MNLNKGWGGCRRGESSRYSVLTGIKEGEGMLNKISKPVSTRDIFLYTDWVNRCY